MNWKLIFQLSLFGLFMALATIFLIPTKIEWIFWLVILLICAFQIAKKANRRYFLHGFLVSLLNCVYITTAHVMFFDTYIANHPAEAAMSSPIDPKLLMIIVGPIIGIISGLILGLFSFIASKIFKKKSF